MTIKEKQNIASLLCEYFISPVKEYGAYHEDIAANAMRFIQDLLRKEKDIAEMVSFFETQENINAGQEFLEELNIRF